MTLQFGENMLMAAIRARNPEVAAYLIHNNIDTQQEATRFVSGETTRQKHYGTSQQSTVHSWCYYSGAAR